jgi:hypothetical protein
MPGNVAITTSSVPAGFCFQSFQNDWSFLVSLLSGNLANVGNFVNTGSATPIPANQDKYWLRDNADGTPDKIYRFTSGVWVAAHPIPPGFTMIAPAGLIASDIPTLDGGEAAALTVFTGPMWEVDTDFSARFPVGPGTLASGLVLNPGDSGGEEKHSLALSEIPSHKHFCVDDSQGTGTVSTARFVADRSPNTGNAYDLVGSDNTAGIGPTSNTGGDGSASGAAAAHNTMPPYKCRIFIRRTLRRFYRL